MGLTSSLFAGLTGLKVNEFNMDVIGNNIANVNTIAYKASSATFQTQFSRNFTFGSSPTGSFGGTNPMQVGTGTTTGAVTRDFSVGSPETTGQSSDVAIQGDGLFILRQADGNTVYTRDGSFQFNSSNELVNADGNFVMGYTVDSNFDILDGSLSTLRVPLGDITTATATSSVTYSGTLNSDGTAVNNTADPSACRAEILSQALTDGGGPAATAATLLTNLQTGGQAVFLLDNVVTLSGAEKGGATLQSETFTVEATSTLGHYMAWLEDALGIFNMTDYTDLTDMGVGTEPGVSVTAGGEILIRCNEGALNQVDVGRVEYYGFAGGWCWSAGGGG